jgi:ankyrin repeat protein
MADNFFQFIQDDQADAVQSSLSAQPSLLATLGPGGWPALHLAAYFGSLRSLEVLVKAGADIELCSQNDNANTPLHAAVAGGQPASVKALVAAGANMFATYFHGTSVLHEAAFLGRDDLVELLISLGAKPSVINDKGETPADIARQRGHGHIADLLENT